MPVQRTVLIIVSIVGIGATPGAPAETEIHKCADADGGVVYSQLPCAPAKAGRDENADDEELADAGEPEPADDALPGFAASEAPQRSEQETAVCKKRYRDAIDAIDAEIGREYSTDQAEAYKQRLIGLTRELRNC